MKNINLILLIIMLSNTVLSSQTSYESDIIKTSNGDLKMTFIGHGTLMFEYNGKVIHIDPVGMYFDYSKMPDADLILITHHHGDHLDPSVLKQIRGDNTQTICSESCLEKLEGAIVMKNGDKKTVSGITVEAVPAYNIIHKRSDGNPYHSKGVGNGYILTFGDTRVYVAGDTENIPEMRDLKDIDIAFLPMNLPYTMSPEMVADATRMINPKIMYPYHYGNTDVNEIVKLLKDKEDCEIRIRNLQ